MATILVISKSPIVQFGLHHILNSIDQSQYIVMAEDCCKVMELAVKIKFDIVILDEIFQGPDDAAFLDNIRKIQPEIRVILFFSSNNVPEKECYVEQKSHSDIYLDLKYDVIVDFRQSVCSLLSEIGKINCNNKEHSN